MPWEFTCTVIYLFLDIFADVFAGGGIVFDSDEYDEWQETMNKLGANMHCITSAENIWAKKQKQKQ